jgi:glycosyltransferase involved in cell wall biosynthesis
MVEKRLTVIQMLPDLETGGVEQGTLELGNFLAARGHGSLVVSRGGRMVEDLEAGGSIHVTLPFIGEKSPRPLFHLGKLRRLVGAADVLHLRSRVPAWAGYLAWKSLPLSRRPLLVTTFHGVYSVNAYSAIMTRGERVIAVSESIEAHILNNYPMDPSRLVCISRGADSRRFDPDRVGSDVRERLRRDWGCDEKTALILMPGRFSRLKAQDLLLHALKGLGDLCWKLVLVGDPAENPEYAKELKSLALPLGDRVIFAGYRKDMPELLAASDLLVSPSRKPESFGRILAEAGMMGKPVLASAHGGSLEIVEAGVTGLFFAPEDGEDLGTKLRILLENPEQRKRMGEAGRMRVKTRFTTEVMCEKTLALYEEALAQKRG